MQDYGTEGLHGLHGCVVTHVDIRHQKVLVVLDHDGVKFLEGHVLAVILLLKHLREALLAQLVFA